MVGKAGTSKTASDLLKAHPATALPDGRIGTRAYNADNRRGVAGVADVGLQLKVSP